MVASGEVTINFFELVILAQKYALVITTTFLHQAKIDSGQCCSLVHLTFPKHCVENSGQRCLFLPNLLRFILKQNRVKEEALHTLLKWVILELLYLLIKVVI